MNMPANQGAIPTARPVTCPQCKTVSHLGSIQPGEVPVCSNDQCRAYLPWVVDATDMTLMDELKCPVTVLLDFWAPWCGPCMRMKPLVESLATQWPGRLKIVFADVDRARGMAATYEVMAVPVLFVGRQGQVLNRIDGEVAYDQLAALIGQYV